MPPVPYDDDAVAPGGVDRRSVGLWLASAFSAASTLSVLSPLGSAVARAADRPGLAPDIQAIKGRGRLLVAMTDFDSAPFYFSRDRKT